jgi:hypothetical protein
MVDLVLRHHLGARPGVGAAQPHGAQAHTRRTQYIILGMIADKPGWHQVRNAQELGEALQQVKDAGLIPAEAVPALCGVRWR